VVELSLAAAREGRGIAIRREGSPGPKNTRENTLTMLTRMRCSARSGEVVDGAQLRGDVAHGGQHGDAVVLELRLAAAREVRGVAVRLEGSQYLKESACQHP